MSRICTNSTMYSNTFLLLLCFFGGCYGDEQQNSTKDIDDECDDEQNNLVLNSTNISSYLDDIGLYITNHLESSSIKFYFKTPDNETIEINGTSPLLNSSQPLKILIHGQKETHNVGWIDTMTTRYHSAGGVDVVVVDWSMISTSIDTLDVTSIDEAGHVIGNFIMEVTTDNVDLLSGIHIIGNDLGAHVGGVAGENVQNNSSQKIGRITGLDPCNNITDRLSSDDAVFVDCIHTQTYFDQNSYGTIDLYVLNNDTNKVLCINDTCAVGTRASDFYSDTIINENVYLAVHCDNKTLFLKELCGNNTDQKMGEYVLTNITGKYFMKPSAGSALNVNNLMLIMCFWCFLYHIFK